MSECVFADPELQGLRRLAMLTLNAERFYQDLGFTTEAGTGRTAVRMGTSGLW